MCGLQNGSCLHVLSGEIKVFNDAPGIYKDSSSVHSNWQIKDGFIMHNNYNDVGPTEKVYPRPKQ